MSIKQQVVRLITNKLFFLIIYSMLAIFAAIQAYTHEKSPFQEGGVSYTKYNNYIIFTSSFEHLIQGKNLYIEYPEQHWDLYKYTPTFSVFFGIFYFLPNWFGLIVWNLLNALIILAAIYYLPNINMIRKGYILLILIVELMTSLQNQQSNGLIAGLLMLAFASMERKHYALATFAIVSTAFIKLFGVIAILMLLFYPKKWKSAIYTMLWIVVLFIVPLSIISFSDYINQLNNYLLMLRNDKAISYGFSVLGILHAWFGLNPNKNFVLLLGFILLSIPFIKPIYISRYSILKNKSYDFGYLKTTFNYRIITMASILIWLVIFNHKAESPTFIIAVTGVAIWIATVPLRRTETVLFASVFIFTILSPTDIFPKSLRTDFFIPYYVKAMPCILVYCYLTYQLLKNQNCEQSIAT